MKSLVENLITFLVAMTGLIGGLFWAIKSNWDFEPSILIAISSIIIGFYDFKSTKEKQPLDAGKYSTTK
jgi:hypothetical protein